jgi:hypothetical protein
LSIYYHPYIGAADTVPPVYGGTEPVTPIYWWKTASSTNRQGNAKIQHHKSSFVDFLDVYIINI